MLALLAALCFVVAAVLKLTESALGQLDYVVFALAGLTFVAAHLVHPIAIRR